MQKSAIKLAVLLMALMPVLFLNSCQEEQEMQIEDELVNLKAGELEGEMVTYWGEETFTREDGKPKAVTMKIGSEDLQHFEDCFVLKIKNGNEDGTKRVSSALVKVDGEEIFGTKDFNLEVGCLEKEICGLTEQSEIEVELRSEFGSFLVIWIDGEVKENHAYITPNGGSFIFLNGNLELKIDNGAVDEPIYISVQDILPDLPTKYRDVLTHAFEFLPDGFKFNKDIVAKLNIPKPSSEEIIPISFGQFSLITEWIVWNRCRYLENENSVEFKINHFSIWGGVNKEEFRIKEQSTPYYFYIEDYIPNADMPYGINDVNRYQKRDIIRSFNKWNTYSQKLGIEFKYKQDQSSHIKIDCANNSEAFIDYDIVVFNNNWGGKLVKKLFYKEWAIVLNKNYTNWRSTFGLVSNNYSGGFDIERVVTHEIGHIFSFGEEYGSSNDYRNEFSVMGDLYLSRPISIFNYDLIHLSDLYNYNYNHNNANQMLSYPNNQSFVTLNDFFCGDSKEDILKVKVIDRANPNVGIEGITVVYQCIDDGRGSWPFESELNSQHGLYNITSTDNNGIASLKYWKLPDSPGQYVIKAKAWLEPIQYTGSNDEPLREVTFTVNISNNSTVNWTHKRDFPAVGMRRPLSFSTSTKGYIGVTETHELWEYQQSSDTWLKKANIPNAIWGHNGWESPNFVVDDKFYVVGYNQLWMYNPDNNSWTRKKDFPIYASNYYDNYGFGFSINGMGYVGLGGSGKLDFYQYNPSTNSWKRMNNHPCFADGNNGCYIDGTATFTINGKGYVTGTNSGFWEYNSYNDTWTEKAYVRSTYGQGFAIEDKGYVYNTLGDLYEYSPNTNNWELIGTLPGDKICYPGGFSLNGKGYIGVGTKFINNGCTTENTNDFWEFNLD
ncbi:Kelch repeat-containing protein [Maribellus mangrovi]|uniref:Kelch repeat-containing protein n=1 Tax=Maribellus mangrovi TaxID=3133146 RepID=UPI0030ED85C2